MSQFIVIQFRYRNYKRKHEFLHGIRHRHVMERFFDNNF